MSSSWEDPPKTVPEDLDKNATEDPPKTMQEDPNKAWGASTARGNWTFLKDKSEVRCNLCMRNLNLTGVPESQHNDIMLAHAASKGHQEIKKNIKQDEEHKRLEVLRTEFVKEKVQEILACTEDHPKFLNHQWIPLGGFLKIWKMSFHEPGGQIFSEFLVTAHHDESEIIFEILQWLDEDI